MTEVDKTIQPWTFCPECGSEDKVDGGSSYEHFLCANCGQDWYSDMDYTDVIVSKLQNHARLQAKLDDCKDQDREAYARGYKAGMHAARIQETN